MEKLDDVFKALSDPARRALLDSLYAKNGQTLSGLWAALAKEHEMTRQAVTKHLVALEAANLVVTLWRGREKLHYLNPVPLHEISERWLGKFDRAQLKALTTLKQELEKPRSEK